MKSFSTQMDQKQRGFMPNLIKLHFGYSNYTCEAFKSLWEGDESKCPLANHWRVSTCVMLGARSFVLVTLAPHADTKTRLVCGVPHTLNYICHRWRALGQKQNSSCQPSSVVTTHIELLPHTGSRPNTQSSLEFFLLYTNKRKLCLAKFSSALSERQMWLCSRNVPSLFWKLKNERI